MANDDLSHSIEALRQEIHLLDVDTAERQRLEQLLAKLEDQVLRPRKTGSLENELPNLIERFEVEHPTLTQVLNRVMVSLSNMGI